MNADLQRLLVENLHVDPGGLRPESGLEEAGLDSLVIAELGMLLADQDVQIPDEQWAAIRTLADLDAVVGEQLTGRYAK
jgi:acyl carrier protein